MGFYSQEAEVRFKCGKDVGNWDHARIQSAIRIPNLDIGWEGIQVELKITFSPHFKSGGNGPKTHFRSSKKYLIFLYRLSPRHLRHFVTSLLRLNSSV
jgi:hypothetical protein